MYFKPGTKVLTLPFLEVIPFFVLSLFCHPKTVRPTDLRGVRAGLCRCQMKFLKH